MRVLISVNDATGHVLPVLPLLRELVGRGHQVLVACPGPTAARLVTVAGAETRTLAPHPVPPVEDCPPHGQHAARLTWAVQRSWPNDGRGWTGQLVALARGWQPDLVVVEPVEHAGRVAAAALGLPVVEHGWGFTLPAGTESAASQGISDVYDAYGATARPPALRLDVGPAELQADDIEPGVERFRFMPWSPAAAPLPAPVAGRPRVLVTLGTFDNPRAAERIRVAVEAVAGLGVEVVVALGNADRTGSGSWPDGVLVVEWLDFASEVTRCDLVLHHAGAGSSLTTATSGVAAVCLPQAGDQFRNAALLEAAGAALVLEPDQADRTRVAGLTARALADPAIAAAAARLAAHNTALPGPGAMVDRLELLMTSEVIDAAPGGQQSR